MKYDKPPVSFEEQADRLINRGLIANRALLVSRLKNVPDVNYYRLSDLSIKLPGGSWQMSWALRLLLSIDG